jgi:hypothetical protein
LQCASNSCGVRVCYEKVKGEISFFRGFVNKFVDRQLKWPENRRLKWPEIWKNEVEAFRRLHGRRGFRRSLLKLEGEGGMTTDRNELEILPLLENGRGETASQTEKPMCGTAHVFPSAVSDIPRSIPPKGF